MGIHVVELQMMIQRTTQIQLKLLFYTFQLIDNILQIKSKAHT